MSAHRAPTRFRLPTRQIAQRAVIAVALALALVAGAFFSSLRTLPASADVPVMTVEDFLAWCSAHNTPSFRAKLTSNGRTWIQGCANVGQVWASSSPSPTPTATASPTGSATPSPTTTTLSPSPTTPVPSPTTLSPSPTASPTPSPSPSPSPPPSGWPGPDNTGVPAGVTLTPYTGPCTITVANTVIDAKTVNCSLSIRAAGVIVTRSLINGTVSTDEAMPYSFALTDTEVNAPVVQVAAVGTTRFSLLRVNVHGGALSVYCWAHCRIEDSWLHGQSLPAGANWHLGALRADENDDPHNDADPAHDAGVTDLVAVHNKIACDTPANSSDGGCSGGVTMYGDFGTVNHVTLDRNLLVASTDLSYCLYGGSISVKPFPNAHDIVVTNNVWQRGSTGQCGFYGPVAAYDVNAPGNVWSGNTWDAGGSVAPAL